MVAGGILKVLGLVVAVILTIVKPCMLPYIILIIILLIMIVFFFKLYTFGMTKFKWHHVQKLEKHTMTLKSDNTGTDVQIFKTIPKKNFSGMVEGFYDWSDVSVNKVKFNANNARISFKSKDVNKKITSVTGTDTITLERDPISANYEITFTDNEPQDVQLHANFTYDIDIMKPKFYFDASRPVKKLIMELQVEEGVPLHNVKKCICAQYGDKNQVFESKMRRRHFDDNPSLTTYRFIVKNPKLLHDYKITWEWIKE